MAERSPLLIDLGDAPEAACNCAFDSLYKAIAEDPVGDEASIWAPHHDPLLAGHIEECYRRLATLLQAVQDDFARALTGEAVGDLAKAEALPWLRWTDAQFAAARQRLQDTPQARWGIEDWMLLAEWLIQKYLPEGVIQGEAEFLTVRAALLGKIQTAMDANHPLPDHLAEALAAQVPTAFAKVPTRALSPVELETMHVARARAAMHISAVSEATRRAMQGLIIEHVQAQVLGQKEGTPGYLRQRIFDAFGPLNRDFRRIAVTEAGECCNQGFIAAARIGSRVKRKEAYRGACDFCKSIDGKVFVVVEPDAPEKNGDTQVWLGKTNVGRSASPRRRVGAQLQERTPAERWWPAAGVQHPMCRGAWLPMVERPEAVSPEFAGWLDGLITKAKGNG